MYEAWYSDLRPPLSEQDSSLPSDIDPLEPDWTTIVVVGFRVTSLVVQGHTDVVVGAVDAGAVRKLLHLRLRAGPTSEISIATNGCEVSRAEVVIRSAAVSVI